MGRQGALSRGNGDGRATAVRKDRRQTAPFLTADDLKRAFKRFRRDQITDRAAGLTYYSLMSLFPGLLFGVAMLGLVGQQGLIANAADYLRNAGAPRQTVDSVVAALQAAQHQRGTAVTALVLGAATSLYGASGAFGAVGRALNAVFRVEEGRGFVRQKAGQVLWTLACVALMLVTLVLIFLGGGLANDVLGAIGLGSTFAAVWQIVRWPVAVVVAMVLYAVVYYAAPNVEVRRFRWITPGAVLGVLLWILASGAFFFYVSNFSSYSATYGAFASVVILLVWLWLTNLILLFGAELNAVVDLRRAPNLPAEYDGPPLPVKEPAKS